MMILNQNHVDASAAVLARPWAQHMASSATDRNAMQVISVAPAEGGFTGEDRLQVNTGITGVHAHAAVRMHAFPVAGSFWAYCPKTKTPFQRLKVAT